MASDSWGIDSRSFQYSHWRIFRRQWRQYSILIQGPVLAVAVIGGEVSECEFFVACVLTTRDTVRTLAAIPVEVSAKNLTL
jgi:hypothetical protein